MKMQFEWTSFYSEFATKLLEFKDNRAELIADIQSAYSAINMKLPKLESEDSIIDIDPFTVFGLFNKGITNANRIAILESFATVFNIKSKVPDNFDGIPVLNNLKATYYGFKDDRQADDIDNLWGLYESAINLAEKDDAISNDESLGDGFCIGHSYFCNLLPDTIDDQVLSGIVEYELIPLLKEYWFDEPTKVKDWSSNLRSAIK